MKGSEHIEEAISLVLMASSYLLQTNTTEAVSVSSSIDGFFVSNQVVSMILNPILTGIYTSMFL
jgi:hypothetical protein